jgi:ribulose 1,5-bisphosphate synthetase/thiazole synthase
MLNASDNSSTSSFFFICLAHLCSALQASVSMHVLIVGAGIGGLTLAQTLRKQGISFEIFERDEDQNARFQGWAIALHTYVSPRPVGSKSWEEVEYSFDLTRH